MVSSAGQVRSDWWAGEFMEASLKEARIPLRSAFFISVLAWEQWGGSAKSLSCAGEKRSAEKSEGSLPKRRHLHPWQGSPWLRHERAYELDPTWLGMSPVAKRVWFFSLCQKARSEGSLAEGQGLEALIIWNAVNRRHLAEVATTERSRISCPVSSYPDTYPFYSSVEVV